MVGSQSLRLKMPDVSSRQPQQSFPLLQNMVENRLSYSCAKDITGTAFAYVGDIAPRKSSGIKVVIVGCGFAGLACAIECTRKGHDVVVLEQSEETKLQTLGDVLSFGPNAGRIIERWGLHDRLWPLCGHAPALYLHNHQGDLLNVQPLPELEFGARAYNGHRGQMHTIFLEHARALGVDIRLGMQVSEYWEDPGHGIAGVVVRGERIEGNVVVGADGVRSKARTHVLGYQEAPKPSGYAIYRAWFNAQKQGIDRDPLTDFMTKGEDVVYAWIGRDVHFITSCSQGGTAVSCVLTHRDDSDIEEGWSFPGKIDDVLDVVHGWDARCSAVLSKAPSFVDWKLVHRDPLPTWVSPTGHLVLIGDAAHPFLPTSIQGASQAVEDGVTLAVTLQLSGKTKVPLAVRSWEHLRYQRVRLAQLMGESTRDKWHRNTTDSHGQDLDLPRPEWLFAFDAERHAYDACEQVSRDIREGGYKRPTLP